MSFETNTASFEDWLKSNSFKMSTKVKINDFRPQNQGRGMIALEDINEDEELFSVPRKAIFDVTNCSLVEDFPNIKEKLGTLSQWEALIFALVYEFKMKKECSFWGPYFNILPMNDKNNYIFNQLVFWSDKELELLSPSLIIERVGKKEVETMYQKIFLKFLEESEIPDFEVSYEEYLKAAATIMSYSFDVEDRFSKSALSEEGGQDDEEEILEDDLIKSLVPLADILNADTKLCNSRLVYTDDALEMRATQIIEKGTQIFNSYSDHPNSEILRRYGYVETSGSRNDFGEVPMSLIEDYFTSHGILSNEILEFFMKTVKNISENEGEMEDIFSDSFDCFNGGEITTEMVFTIQLVTVFEIINERYRFIALSMKDKIKLTNRIFKKIYQLLESQKLSERFLIHYKNILNERILQYPDNAKNFTDFGTALSRGEMSQIVLKYEHQSLESCLDIDQALSQYKFTSDDKIIKNIVKGMAIKEKSIN